ncbi:YhdB family protein [Oceanobacillus sp. CFH 90083]|uniref:YhdB family protein n=1 Tax=Oceanobacillus sp. CFH 90083 TaxID=2592336 RepID=UPI00128CC6B8|nr:YhdB family protein [Oceanobacillus sp. CFH 90083]
MLIPDYDKALYYTIWGQWDNLFLLMSRTNDDLLAKKIEHFLYAYHHSSSQKHVDQSHDTLLYYLEHALQISSPWMYEFE